MDFCVPKKVIFSLVLLCSSGSNVAAEVCDLYSQYREMFESKSHPGTQRSIGFFNNQDRELISKLDKTLQDSDKKRSFSNVSTFSDIEKKLKAKSNKNGTVVFLDELDSRLSSIFNYQIQSVEVRKSIINKYQFLHVNMKEFYNSEKHIEITRKLKAMPPMILKYDVSGNELGRIYKCYTKDELLAWLK